MKKIFITSIVALALIASTGVANAVSGYVFSNYLTIGSKGADVSALQNWLISQGYDIPAISSGAAQTGYFGQQTKMAVVKYQASVGLPNTGFVGPLTVAKLNGTAGTVVVTGPVTCPIGYTCTPSGAPGPVINPGTVVMDGTDGSMTVSLSSFASNTTIKKGETKDMVAVKLQATAGPVTVTRFDVRFNVRPWLYFNTITLKDSNGAVIATKNLSSSADATEITVGSDYLVRFEGINATVTPGSDKTLVVSGTVISTTDKLTSDVPVIVSIPNSSIRTMNGKGYTDSIGLGTVAVSGTTGRTVTLSSSGSTGNILVRISPNTPATRIQTTSTNGETTGVVLGKFDFKSENRSSTINTLTFTLKKSAIGVPFSTLFKRVYISDGSTTYNVDSVGTSSVFSNLNINLAQDEWKTFTLTADVADADDFTAFNGVVASSTITVNTTNIVGVDSNYTNVTASGANTVTTNDTTLLQSGASLSNMAATSVLNDNGTSKSKSATITFVFTFNNTGTTDLYVSANPSLALATSSTVSTAGSTTLTAALVSTNPGSRAGDSGALTNTGYYIVPSGTSRDFIFTGTLDNTNGTAALHSAIITKVYFADDTTNLQEFNIGFGLERLQTPPVNI